MRLRTISIVSNYNYIETFMRWAEASKIPSAVIYQNTVENALIFKEYLCESNRNIVKSSFNGDLIRLK